VLEKMGGMMKSWADERERLVQQLEQTQAYCSSLAFQVKSLQEENRQLVSALAIKDQERGRGSHTPVRHESMGSERVSQRGGHSDEEHEDDDSIKIMSQSSEMRGRWGPPVMLEPNLKFGQLEEEGEEEEASHVSAMRDGPNGETAPAEGEQPTSNPSVWVAVWKSPRQGMQIHGIDTTVSSQVATVCWDGSCDVFELEPHARGFMRSWKQPARPSSGLYAVSFGLKGEKRILATACMDSLCHLLSGEDGRLLQSLKGHTGEVNSLNFQRDVSGGLTNRLVSGSDDMTCVVWDVERGLPVQTLAGEHEEAVYGVKFHKQDACLVASVAFDRMGFLWDLRQKSAALRLEGHRDDVIGLDFSPCGKFLATGSDDSTCRLWDLRRTFTTVDELQHAMEVKRIAWSPCGRWLAAGSSDCTAYVWNTERMPCTLEGKLEGHTAQIFDVAWLPSSLGWASLVTASHDHHWIAWGPSLDDV